MGARLLLSRGLWVVDVFPGPLSVVVVISRCTQNGCCYVISWCTLDGRYYFLVHFGWLLLIPGSAQYKKQHAFTLYSPFFFHMTFVDHRAASDSKSCNPACSNTWNGDTRKTQATSFRCETFSQWHVQSYAWVAARLPLRFATAGRQ